MIDSPDMPLEPRGILTLELLQHVLMQSLRLHSRCCSSISESCIDAILIGKIIQSVFLLLLLNINNIPPGTLVLVDSLLVRQVIDLASWQRVPPCDLSGTSSALT